MTKGTKMDLKMVFLPFSQNLPLDFSDDFRRGRRPSTWGISKNWRRENILIFAIVKWKCDSEIPLTAAISTDVEHKIFEICARGRIRHNK